VTQKARGLGAAVMLPRPRPFAAAGGVRLAITVLLAIHVFISAWLVASVEASYTEGRPAPTEFHSLVAIDNEQTFIDVRIEKATAFFLYVFQRDDSAKMPVNISDDDPSGDDGSDDDDSQWGGSERDWLKIGRNWIKASLVLLVLSELLMMIPWKWRHYLRAFAFSMTLVAFAAFPVAYVAGLGGGNDGGDSSDGGGSAVEGAPGAGVETQSFVHSEEYVQLRPIWLGFELQADFSGYDLGLVDEEDRPGVIAQPPEENSTEAKSFVAFESTFSIELGKNLDSLLILPFMWYFLPAIPINRKEKTYGGLLESE